MVELGRRFGSGPAALADIAKKEQLPLDYLEHVAADLRKAELVVSQRGAHGGYKLSRPPESITMLEIIQALEGSITPMECFVHEGPELKVLCSHELDGDKNCSTKILWLRVQEGVSTALHDTKLGELVDFAESHKSSAAA